MITSRGQIPDKPGYWHSPNCEITYYVIMITSAYEHLTPKSLVLVTENRFGPASRMWDICREGAIFLTPLNLVHPADHGSP